MEVTTKRPKTRWRATTWRTKEDGGQQDGRKQDGVAVYWRRLLNTVLQPGRYARVSWGVHHEVITSTSNSSDKLVTQ